LSNDIKLDFRLHAAQRQVHECPSPYKVVVAGRGWGKSRYAAIDATIKALEEVNWAGRPLTTEAEVMYMAPTFDQAKGMFWPILKEVADPVLDSTIENVCLATLINGVRIRLKGMDNPDRARGFILRHAIMDEFADMSPEAWDVITAPSVMKTNGTALFIGTPKRGKPHLGQMLHHAQEQPVHERWGFPLWAGFQFASSANPFLDKDAIATISSNMSFERMREELEAEILAEGGNYLQPDWWQLTPREPEDGFFVVAVDLGGFTRAPRETTYERRDDTAIAIVKIHRGGWWVKEIQYGRWDVRETVLRILKAAGSVDAHRLGVEKGALYNAMWPYMRDYMAQFGKFYKVEPLTHGNQHKVDRVFASLEGRLQRGRIQLNCSEATPMRDRPQWIQTLIQQASDMPSPRSKDDLVDALSYVDQLGQTVYHTYEPERHDTWVPVDPIAGV
jgi:hypothetical protein